MLYSSHLVTGLCTVRVRFGFTLTGSVSWSDEFTLAYVTLPYCILSPAGVTVALLLACFGAYCYKKSKAKGNSAEKVAKV